jgi:hypothetical protein
MKLTKGIELLDEIIGQGPAAVKGAVVVYNARIFLRRGDEVTQDMKIIAKARTHLNTRFVDGNELIDHVTELGKRRTIAGVEKSLLGMREKGYREVLIAPHLAYVDKGVPNLIPPNAMLRIQLWVWKVIIPTD